ncbi:MAG: DUF58 domain-containing protein, partial [Pirellulales bacterium]
TLARVELTDGLSFDQLIGEMSGRLPRDATVVAVLPAVPPETAFTLGSLRRRGYAVAAVVISFDDYEFNQHAGLLLAQGIEARRVSSEDEIAALCGQHLLR